MKIVMANVFLFVFSTNSYGAKQASYEVTPEVEDTGKFFPARGNTAITFMKTGDEKDFGDLSGKDDKRIRRVPTSVLKSVGINPGDTVQCFNLDKKEFKEYKVKDQVFILLFEPSMGVDSKNTWDRFNFVFSDDPVEHAKALAIHDMEPRDGFCYVGKNFDFSKAKFETIPLKQLTSDKQLPKDVPFNGKMSNSDIRVGTILGNTLFALFEKSLTDQSQAASTLKVPAGTYYFMGGVYLSLYNKKDRSSIEVLKVSEKLKVLFSSNLSKLCFRLNFITAEKITKADTLCGGEWGEYGAIQSRRNVI